MPLFTRAGAAPVEAAIHTLVIAGWTGRDEAALRHHVEELAALGVPAPSAMPVFYRVAAANLTQAGTIQVLGPDTSGEVEPVVVVLEDGAWLTLGSDHTDRRAEAAGIALSKQLCPKPVGTELWRLDEVAPHWDSLLLTSTADGARYQHGPLSAMRTPADLIARGPTLTLRSVMFCGTLGAIGGIRPSTHFAMELHDPVLNRTLRHEYAVEILPVIA